MRFFILFFIYFLNLDAMDIFLGKTLSLKLLENKILTLSPKLLKNVIIIKTDLDYYEAYLKKDVNISTKEIELYKSELPQTEIVSGSNTIKKRIIIDFGNPPKKKSLKIKGNTEYLLEARGSYSPISKNNISKNGTIQNRRAEISLFKSVNFLSINLGDIAQPKNLYSFDICKKKCCASELKNIPIQNRYAFLESNSESNESQIGNSIGMLLDKVMDNKRYYFTILDEQVPFLGIYFSGKFFKYLLSDYKSLEGTKYDTEISLNLELFKNGYFASKKDFQRKINETKISYLQLIFDMKQKSLDEKLFDLQKYRLEVQFQYYKKLSEYYERALYRKNIQLRLGYCTLQDTQYIEEHLDNARRMFKLYSSTELKKIPHQLFLLLNSIECISLIEKKKMMKLSQQSNLSLKIEDRLIDRANLKIKYRDNLRVNLFVTDKSVDKIGNYQSAGINIDIPIDFRGKQNELINIERNNYKLQKNAINKHIEQKISSLYSQYYYQIAELLNLQNSLKYLYDRQFQLQNIQKNIILGFKNNPEKEQKLLIIKILNMKYKIYMQRLNSYEILLQIYYDSGVKNIEEIITNKVKLVL